MAHKQEGKMKKITNTPKAGDIILKSFIDMEEKCAFAHPFVVLSVNDDYATLLDQRAAMALIGMTSVGSSHSMEILENNNPSMIVGVEDGVTKESIIKLDIVLLFAKDILPVDKVGHLSDVAMNKIRDAIDSLDKEKRLKVNKNNLPKIMDHVLADAKEDDFVK